MSIKEPQLLKNKTPLIFTDGTKVYDKLAKKYVKHKKGFFILAPSGAGKTHFVKNQKEKHWMDGDVLWMAAKAHPQESWWLYPEMIFETDQKCDVITAQAKKLGFWIMGASNFWLKPDAIVIPDWNIHKDYIKYRETHNYDGGATSDKLAQVVSHRKWIMQWAKKGVPKFESIEEAVNFLKLSLKKKN